MVEVYISDNEEEKMKEIYQFRYNVYVEELQYLKNDINVHVHGMEFDDYDKYSRHIVLKKDSQIQAYVRIIEDVGQGLLVLNKINRKELFSGFKKVEISRLIVSENARFSKIILQLVGAIYQQLVEMDCTYILADTFKDSNSYKMLEMLGFQELGVEYHDTSYNVGTESIVLYAKKEDICKCWKNTYER